MSHERPRQEDARVVLVSFYKENLNLMPSYLHLKTADYVA